jgi:Fungal Zn(2)-Cys(6) binuclear cluster domain
MNLVNGTALPGPHLVKKQEDTEDKGPGKDSKPVKTALNRVPRSSRPTFAAPLSSLTCTVLLFLGACVSFTIHNLSIALASLLWQNACRKQKMRCEGAENPPCKRCRQQSLECLFEKPNREASLTGEAGLECVFVPHSSLSRALHRLRRIRSLEAHVADIRQSQTAIQNSLVEIVNHLRAGTATMIRSPSALSSAYFHPSPNVHADSPASMSTPVSARPPLDAGHTMMSTPQSVSPSARPPSSPVCSKLFVTSLSRCIPVLPWLPCEQMVMPK